MKQKGTVWFPLYMDLLGYSTDQVKFMWQSSAHVAYKAFTLKKINYGHLWNRLYTYLDIRTA